MTYPKLWDDAVENRVRDAGENRDNQEVGDPGNIQTCTKCCVTSLRPRIVFDDDGICSACQWADRKWNASDMWKERRREMTTLLNRFRTSSTNDVVVPSSGGKDSAAVALAMADHRMQPLCAMWEPHIYTDIGRRNQDRFAHAGFDTVKAQPNGLFHRRLARLAFEFYGDPFMPFVYGQLCWPIHVAVNHGIGLVMFGESGEAEYGGDPAATDKMFWDWDDWDRIYNKGVGIRDLIDLGMELGCFTKNEAQRVSHFYRLPRRETIEQFRIQVAWWSYFEPWHPMENYYLACERTGYEANDVRSEGTYTKFASLDDKLDGLHYYMAYIKFGMGRCTSDANQQIRAGDIERDEAVDLIRRYDGEFPNRHLPDCLNYLNIDTNHLTKIIDRFRPDDLWSADSVGWVLNHQVK